MDNLSISLGAPAGVEEAARISLGVEQAVWPGLDRLLLSASARDGRRCYVGGSDANILLSGNAEKILRLWREKRGEAESEDLSGSLAVMLGSWTEAFNRQWFERLSGQTVTRVGESLTVRHARLRLPHAAAARSMG